ncbi:MAG TPA: hypothetical protein VLV78_19570 [Thermoanaerobaculia bacterium]|nr:hypothetical protein [Thermoanaerobaculia bacterium]
MKISRRSFARKTLVAAAAAAVMPVSAAEVGSVAQNPEVEARVQWIVAKYGAHLNETERADVRRIVSGGQAGVDTMRKYALDNGNGPAEPFRIYRKAPKR